MDETADLPAQLDALRDSGAAERDPIRFAYIEALARRAAGQPETVRQALNTRIGIAVGELAARPPGVPTEIAKESTASPLAELLVYISLHAHEPAPATQPATGTSIHQGDLSPRLRSPQAPELKSVAYFHQAWSKLSTEQQLTQTLAQAPENAGPMNSQHLVLRSLQVMRNIAPDYLQGFMSYIDTLIWLEHANPSKLAAARSSGGEGESKSKMRTEKRSTKNR